MKQNDLSNAIVYSGASYRITYLAGAAHELTQYKFRKEPKAFIGTSSGAMIALLSAMNKRDEMIHITSEDFSQIWKGGIPGTTGGNIRAGLRWIAGKNYLFNQEGLIDLLRDYIIEQEFYDWQNNPYYPACYIGVSFIVDNTESFINIKDRNVGYEEMLKIILASTSQPFFTDPVKWIFGKRGVDGGLKSHAGCGFAARSLDVREIISVFSRPYLITSFPKLTWPKEGFLRLMNLPKILEHIALIWSDQVSRFDEMEGDFEAYRRNLKHTKVHTPYYLSTSRYQVTAEEKDLWFKMGAESVRKSFQLP